MIDPPRSGEHIAGLRVGKNSPLVLARLSDSIPVLGDGCSQIGHSLGVGQGATLK
jgi:hypothetical protein